MKKKGILFLLLAIMPALMATAYQAESSPSFPGGEKALITFFKENVNYPSDGNRKEGRVVLQFRIGKDGSIDNVKCIRTMQPESFNREAVRVARMMPRWIPAQRNGKAISSTIFFPVRFTYGEYPAYFDKDKLPEQISDGTYRIMDNCSLTRSRKVGFADSLGHTIFPPRFSFALPFSDGQALVTCSGHATEEDTDTPWQSPLWYIINKKGEKLMKITYIDSSDFRKGLILNTIAPDGIQAADVTYHYPEEVVNGDADYFSPLPGIRLEDVNFDGHRDIVISLGHYGNQGVEYFDALLWTPRTHSFSLNGAFRKIPNPVCHPGDKAVYASVRNSAASYTYSRYEWTNSRLTQTATLDMDYTARSSAPRFTEWRFIKGQKKLLRRNVPKDKISRFWMNAGLIE